MYHVTNISSRDENGQVVNSDHPDWNEIRPHVANDKRWDGKLVGLPVAFFTTTLYQGDLPTISPYPKSGVVNSRHWRVSVPFNPDHYKILEMARHEKQVHLLCLDVINGNDIEKGLVDILNTGLGLQLYLEADREQYFPDGQANDYMQLHTNYFVNVCFIKPVQIGEDAEWDEVQRKDRGCSCGNDGNAGNEIDLLEAWGEQQIELIQSHLEQKWESLFTKRNPDNRPRQDDGPENNNDDGVVNELADDLCVI